MPDYDKLAAMIVRDKWGDVGIADALRAAYEAGLERAAEIAETPRKGTVNAWRSRELIAAAIRAEKEAEHEHRD